MTPVLHLENVRRTYRGRADTVTAVDGVDLTVAGGELVGLVGPSGSGKTTLLHLALGWERPDSGRVDRAAVVEGALGWSGVAVVPQELGLLPELTAHQNVQLAIRLSGRSVFEPGEVYERLGLGQLVERLSSDLSLGEQQRFAVARAVVAGPRLLVADEPTAHQDERNADGVMGLLAHVADEGGAVLVATHDERILARVDRVVRLIDGRLVGD